MSRISNALRQSDDPSAMMIAEMMNTEKAPNGLPAATVAAANGSQSPLPSAGNSPSSPLAVSEPEVRSLLLGNARTVTLKPSYRNGLFPFGGNDPQAAEQYRVTRTSLLHHPAKPRVVVVSSAGAGDGKTFSSINIAAALAMKNDENVLLIDGDLRRRSVAQVLGIPPSPGLSNVLRGECTFEQAVVRVADMPSLFVLPAGDLPENPSELLDSAAWRTLMARLRGAFRFTLIDSTPAAAVADFDLLQVAADGVLLVVRPDHTNRVLWKNTMSSVVKSKLLGVVVNAVENWPLGPALGTYPYR